ncbi:hypothetical protein CPB84DRAFT_1683104 [Gymnopilus junonius]|uniref:Uncharacterized protein n=1 Tax=Gymnopilus junonius TaxID=109634 RepID=A0A9P5TM50_GYMJU|nr:hypothetical protein CPB84DRAFT_1683104 [Gymnopilus junonius]
MSDGINYAKLFGFESVAAAVVFTILYIPFFGWFVRQSIARPNYVYFVLTLFCTIRVVSFAIRAALAASTSTGENLSLFLADQVLSGVGYFGLLYSAYTLVLDLEQISDRTRSNNSILALTRNRRVFRLILLIAVVLGIVSATQNDPQSSLATTLHKVSIIIFLILTALQLFQTVLLARMDLADGIPHRQGSNTFGRAYGIYILLFIAILLMVREVFTTATLGSPAKFYNEHFWYPLVAVPEILAVLCYSTPDLVPRRDELPTSSNYQLNNRDSPVR